MRAILALILLLPALALAGEVKLKWDANTETDLVGYKVYKSRTGRLPFTLAATVSAPATTVTLSNISTALPHVFAVTAYSASGESAYSNRVKVSVPAARNRAARMSGSISSGF